MKRIASWMVLAALLLGAFSASGQKKLPGKVHKPSGPTFRTVFGVVKDAADRPVANAVVVVLDEDGATDQRMAKGRTDQYGRFNLRYLVKKWDPPVVGRPSASPDIYVTAVGSGGRFSSRTYTDNVSNSLYAFVSSAKMRSYVRSLAVLESKVMTYNAAMTKLLGSSTAQVPSALSAAKSAGAAAAKYSSTHRYPGQDAGTKKIDAALVKGLNNMSKALRALTGKPSSWNAPPLLVYIQGARFSIQSIAASCTPGSSALDGCNCLDPAGVYLGACQPFEDAFSG